MAWISVHDHVVGGKLRELAKDIGCSQKEALGILVSLWLWGLNNADQTGKLRSCDRSDVAEAVFSNGLSEGLDKMGIVESLISQRWIDENEEGDLYLHDWDTWQEQWYKFLKNKEYDAERKRAERARKKAETMKKEQIEESSENNPEDNPTDSPPDAPMDSPPDVKKKPKKTVKKKVGATDIPCSALLDIARALNCQPEEFFGVTHDGFNPIAELRIYTQEDRQMVSGILVKNGYTVRQIKVPREKGKSNYLCLQAKLEESSLESQ